MKLAYSATFTAALIVVALTGCSSGESPTATSTADAPSPSDSSAPSETAPSETTPSEVTASATPAPTDGAEPSAPAATAPTLDELTATIEAAGFACDTLTVNEPGQGVLDAVESGSCAPSGLVLATFATTDGPQAVLDLSAQSGEPGSFLVGDLWLVGSEVTDDLAVLQDTLGGEVRAAGQ
jgi:hypothetical protein